MTRLGALSKLTGIPKESFFTRTSYLTHKPVDENEDEYIVKCFGTDRYYNVYLNDAEIEVRLESMKAEFGDEEVGDNIDSVLTFLGEQDGHLIYRN